MTHMMAKCSTPICTEYTMCEYSAPTLNMLTITAYNAQYTGELVYGVECTLPIKSRPHLNPAIRRWTLGDTLSFSPHSSS